MSAEINELVSYFINEENQTLEVTFRLDSDNEDEIRTDQIDLSESTTFGYNLIPNNTDFYNDRYDDEEDEFDEYYEVVDEDEVISFLNEYYLIYPTKLPKSELF
jgi:hypothetical protein